MSEKSFPLKMTNVQASARRFRMPSNNPERQKPRNTWKRAGGSLRTLRSRTTTRINNINLEHHPTSESVGRETVSRRASVTLQLPGRFQNNAIGTLQVFQFAFIVELIKPLITMRISASLSLSLTLWIAQTLGTSGFSIIHRTVPPVPTTITNPRTTPRFSTIQQQQRLSMSSSESENEPSRLRRWGRSWRKRFRRSATILVAASFWATARPAAHAKFSYELNETPTHSLRPGMSKSQAQQLEEGSLDVSEIESSSVFKQPAESTPKTQQPSKTFDYGEEDDEDDDDFLFDDEGSRGSASQADQATAEKLQAKTTREFAAYQKGKSKALTIKVGLCFFVPTYGFMIVREYVRRRREEAYVQKGLEILEAQKAEYFNVTSKTDDSDVQDALKGLKKNATKTDEDDDDDDDDDEDEDDEDEPPQPTRGGKKPKRPSGGGDEGGDSGGDPGYGKPSDEDLERLNKMFGKS